VSVPSTKLKEPSILLASSNCRKLVRNVAHVLDPAGVKQLEAEIARNVVALFRLGDEHLTFADSIGSKHWRQRASRLYYAALNLKRAVALLSAGHFATDASDHRTIGDLPDDFPDANTFATRLQNLRDDRNLADYSHVAAESDLVVSPPEAEALVKSFRDKARVYLNERGVAL
jgi:hypothetical protein